MLVQAKETRNFMNINQVWPEWNEECVLGEGSFGKVYRAKRVEYGRTFWSAVKVITIPKNQQEVKYAKTQGMTDDEVYNYFRGIVDNLLNEITLMDNLKGAKNIVGIEDYKIVEREGELGWDIFIRMELLTPFDSFVSNPDFSQKDVIKLGLDICSALEICERNYIVHRDIKPDNIFISRFGEYKLGDFGIARKLEATHANLSRKGTLNYMAPEVYKGEEYGSSVDIYSLGLVLYTLLNNNRTAFLPKYPQPISYKDNEEALTKRLSGQPLEPPCNASASLGAAIVKACSFDPSMRYRTATEFKNALIEEWNTLVQTGDNREIRSEAMRFNGTVSIFENTTNDMTSNGRLVVDELDGGTTVLDQNQVPPMYRNPAQNNANQQYQSGQNAPYTPPAASAKYRTVLPESGTKEETYVTAKSNKACRIAAIFMAAVLCVLGIVLAVVGDKTSIEIAACVSLISVGVAITVSDRNKIGVGVALCSLSLCKLFTGIGVLTDGSIQTEIPFDAIVTLAAGALMLFGGIVMISQKEVRLGGVLCVYAIALQWLFNIYRLANGAFEPVLWQIFSDIAALTAFAWAYGYKREEKPYGLKLVLFIITCVTSGAGVIASAVLAFSELF